MTSRSLPAVLCAVSLAVGGAAWAEHAPLPRLSPEEVRNAKTPEQQRALAAAYQREAKMFREKARAHRYMERHYIEPGRGTRNIEFRPHCRALAAALEAAANEAEALARGHRALASADGEKAK